jgi:hypothetical protein
MENGHIDPSSVLYLNTIWRCVVGLIKSRRMRWAGHLARMGKKRNAYRFGGKARGKETTRKNKT